MFLFSKKIFCKNVANMSYITIICCLTIFLLVLGIYFIGRVIIEKWFPQSTTIPKNSDDSKEISQEDLDLALSVLEELKEEEEEEEDAKKTN